MAKTTIKNVWKKIPELSRRAILADIVTKGGVSISTAYAWTSGKRVPLPLYQALIAASISEHTRADYCAMDLFQNN